MRDRLDVDQARVFETATYTRAELRQLGSDHRRLVGRRSLGRWRPADDRPDPVTTLRMQDGGRVPELIPVRYGRMVSSPFAFFRGSAAVMATDLAAGPTTGLRVQACGDAHIENFGVYAGPDRMLVFDVNDFDETLPAPWDIDVRRLATSIVLAARSKGWSDDVGRGAVAAAVERYRDVLGDLATMTTLEIQYRRLDESRFFSQISDPRVVRYTRRTLRKARRRTSHQAFRKWVTKTDGRHRFVEDPPVLTRLPASDEERFHMLYDRYRESLPEHHQHVLSQFRFRDVAHKVVGVGSVGLRAYVVLLEGHGDPDPLVLQVKEATASVLSPHWGASGYSRHGQRVVVGQRRMQATSDPFLGWAPFTERDFYVRQLRDNKGPSGTSDDRRVFEVEAMLSGGTLARAHARSVDPALIAGYLGKSDRVPDIMAAFACAYADQAEADHGALEAAVGAGVVPAERGV